MRWYPGCKPWEMTEFLQLALLAVIEAQSGQSQSTVKFDTAEEYQRWLQEQTHK